MDQNHYNHADEHDSTPGYSNPICTNIKKHPTFPNKSAKKNDKKKMPTPNGVGKQHKHKTSIG